jgi:hypothetical protein
LDAIIGWNRRLGANSVTFHTHISIDAALDEELMSLCARAGIESVFIGVETPNEESLKEGNKFQNLSCKGATLLDKVERVARSGMMIEAGMMVGFDADGPDIFEKQMQFAQTTPIATFALFGLAAPLGTPLYERMLRSNRLVTNLYKRSPLPWEGNVVPAQMTREQFLSGMKWLANNLYALDNFTHRLLRWIDLQPRPETRSEPVDDNSYRSRIDLRGSATSDFIYTPIALAKAFMHVETNASEAWRCIASSANSKRIPLAVILRAISIYLQTRYILQTHGMWDTSLYGKPFHRVRSGTAAGPIVVSQYSAQ